MHFPQQLFLMNNCHRSGRPLDAIHNSRIFIAILAADRAVAETSSPVDVSSGDGPIGRLPQIADLLSSVGVVLVISGSGRAVFAQLCQFACRKTLCEICFEIPHYARHGYHEKTIVRRTRCRCDSGNEPGFASRFLPPKLPKLWNVTFKIVRKIRRRSADIGLSICLRESAYTHVLHQGVDRLRFTWLFWHR